MSNNNCAICLEEISEEKEKLDCKHEFHKKCIYEWFKIKRSCPLCRSPEGALPRSLECLHERYAGDLHFIKRHSESLYELVFNKEKNFVVAQLNQNGTTLLSGVVNDKKVFELY